MALAACCLLLAPKMAQLGTLFHCTGSRNTVMIGLKLNEQTMTEFAVSTTINAPINIVWAALADIGNIADWNPGVQASRTTSDQTEGVGSQRYCDLGGKNYLNEEVVTWRENEAITFRIVETNMPFDSADIRFTLTETSGGTHVTCSPVYKLKFGLLGTLLDRAFVKRTYSSGMGDLLAGLKAHCEQSASSPS